jgi:putative chitinase
MNLEKLKGHIPDSVISQIPDTMQKFELNTPLRLAHFLAQTGHESGGFKATSENLNYGAKGLLGIFKKYFPTEAKAKEYERKPEKMKLLVKDTNSVEEDTSSLQERITTKHLML